MWSPERGMPRLFEGIVRPDNIELLLNEEGNAE
jgi:hypothetical protein